MSKTRMLVLVSLVLVAGAIATFFYISNFGRYKEREVAISKPTSTKMVEGCAKSPSDPRSASSKPTPETFSMPITSTAKSFEELHTELLGSITEYTDAKLPLAEIYSRILTIWSNEVYGKRISATRAWIIGTGDSAMNSLEMTRDERFNKHSYPGDFSDAVLITLTNPFTITTERTTVPWGILEDIRPKIVLAHTKETNGQQLCIGQEISFEAEVRWDPAALNGGGYDNATELVVPNADVTIVDDSRSGRKQVREDLSGTIVKFSHTLGFMGFVEFNVTLYGNGLVSFSGFSEKEVGQPTHYKVVSEDVIRQSLGEFAREDFYTLDTSYGPPEDAVEVHSPWVILSVTDGTTTKSVRRYVANKEAPERLRRLEAKIYRLLEVDEWTGLCGSRYKEYAPYLCK